SVQHLRLHATPPRLAPQWEHAGQAPLAPGQPNSPHAPIIRWHLRPRTMPPRVRRAPELPPALGPATPRPARLLARPWPDHLPLRNERQRNGDDLPHLICGALSLPQGLYSTGRLLGA